MDTVGRSGSGHGREADTVERRKAARAPRIAFAVGSFAACDRFVTGRLRPGRRSMCVGRGVVYAGGASMTMSGCSSVDAHYTCLICESRHECLLL